MDIKKADMKRMDMKRMDIKKISVPYVLLGLSYILHYFTRISELDIVIGLIYIYLAFRH